MINITKKRKWNLSKSDSENEIITEFPRFWRTFNIYKKEMETMKMKYKRNITFLEARKIVESYMKVTTYDNETQKATPISNNDDQPDK